MIARVEPLTTTRRLTGPFDYALDGHTAAVGSVVRVPFGAQALRGVVVALADTTDVPADKLVTVTRVEDASIPAELVDLARWLAVECCSTVPRALQLVLPPKGRPRLGLWASAARAPEEDEKLTDAQRDLLAALPGWTAELGGTGPLRRLEKRGLVTIEERVQRRSPTTIAVGTASTRPALTPDQEAALAQVPERGAVLLHGVTGSGKTEVYLQLVARALERGEGAIVLVPEIALTPQTVARFQARFGDTVAVLHSALGEGERHDEWLRLRRGEARVAVGPRSAVFAPVRDLGLIVVDEEHDASFKHEGDPRYDARRVAARRAPLLVCGTATPRPETAHALPAVRLAHRVDGRPLPPVEVVSLLDVPRGGLHPRTWAALSESRKAIVLLNRRGWSNFLECKTCGKGWTCPNCDVALVLHRAERTLGCHHCGHRERVPTRCDRCGSVSVARHGAGTEQVEHELGRKLGLPVFRLDADSGAAKDAVPRLLAAFQAAPEGLLLGTQVVAKGHDFADVDLGVVLDADQTLRFPDFRAEERTFAMVAQLAGRAGRGTAGKVVVQTRSPDAPAIAAAAAHDADAFLAGELERRRTLHYPPFADLVRVVCSAEAGDEPAFAAAGEVAAALDGLHGTEVLGPAPLFRLRGRERFQVVVKARDRAPAVRAVAAAVEGAARRREHRDVAFSVDVDPQ